MREVTRITVFVPKETDAEDRQSILPMVETDKALQVGTDHVAAKPLCDYVAYVQQKWDEVDNYYLIVNAA